MAKASAQITLTFVVDIKATYRYYLLQSSTSSAPSKPTTYPPSSSWNDTEPTYTEGSTNSLYFVDCTVFTNDTFKYSDVSLSSAYESAKSAYNKAVAAHNAAQSAQNSINVATDVIVGTQTAVTGAWTGVAKFSSLKDGQQIIYWLPYAGSGNATLNLTLSSGATTGAKNCYYTGTTRLTTHYAAGSMIRLVYKENMTIAGSSTKYTGWWADANYAGSDTYDRTRYNKAIKCGTTKIAQYNIIVGKNGVYQHLKSGASFDITYPILYANSEIAASSTGSNNYLCMYVTITTTQNISLTAYKPVYIKGKLSGTLFTPVSTTPLTQTVPTSADGYDYILLGQAYESKGMYLLPEHPIFTYYIDGFKSFEQIAMEASKTATDYMEFDNGLVIGDMTTGTLGNNVFIDNDSVDIRKGSTILASYGEKLIELGKNALDAVVSFCNGRGKIRYVTTPEPWENDSGSDFIEMYSDYNVRVRGVESAALYTTEYDENTNASKSSVLATPGQVDIYAGWSTNINPDDGVGTWNYSLLSLGLDSYLESERNLTILGGGKIQVQSTADSIELRAPMGGVNVYGNVDATKFTTGSYKSAIMANWEGSEFATMSIETSDVATTYIRTPPNGILPYNSGGHGNIGTAYWPFDNMFTNNLYVGGRQYAVNKVLWSGGSYMTHTQTAYLTEAITAQPHGVVLVWDLYENGAAQAKFLTHNFIPKAYISNFPGRGILCNAMSGMYDKASMAKFVYVNDTTIAGHSYNSTSATSTPDSVIYNNSLWVLRLVIGV